MNNDKYPPIPGARLIFDRLIIAKTEPFLPSSDYDTEIIKEKHRIKATW